MTMQPGSFVRISTDTLGFAGNLGIGAITSVDVNNSKKQRSVCFIPRNNFSSIVFLMKIFRSTLKNWSPLPMR